MALNFRETFGEGSLISKGGKYNLENLKDKDYVGLYFSAHWCPPCRGFTPQLAEYYNNYNAKHQGKLEIVFVSSDRNETDFKEYYKDMPWIALKFTETAAKGSLSQKYGITGIPTLVILDRNGNLITSDGRGQVAEDPEGLKQWN